MAPGEKDPNNDPKKDSSETGKIEPGFGDSPSNKESEDWYEASAQEKNPPLEEIPDLNEGDLKTDTLEFERVSRQRPRNKSGLKWAILLVLFGGGAYAIWEQWGDGLIGRKADELPVVRAPEGPMKVRPEQPGGIDIPNRDKLVYDRLEKKPPEANMENLLPRPEVPLSPPEQKPVDKAELPSQPDAKGEPETTAVTSAAEGPKSAPPPEPKSAPPTVREVIAATKPSAVPPPPLVKEPEPAAKKATAKPAPVKAAPGDGYQIQLAAVRKQEAAKSEWQRLSKKHNSLLGQLSLNVVRADLGNKGIFYRLRAGPIADLTAAKTLCQALVKQKVGCLVVRPKK